jgi:hypothetical protein
MGLNAVSERFEVISAFQRRNKPSSSEFSRNFPQF